MNHKEMLKSLIEMAESFEDADRIIMEYTSFEETSEKLAFIHGMFNVAIVGAHTDASIDEAKNKWIDYVSVLTAIVNKKWR